MNIEPVTLTGKHIRLEPRILDHHDALCEIGVERELWRWTVAEVLTPEDMRAYLRTALQLQYDGTALAFVTVENSSDRVVGSSKAERPVELGPGVPSSRFLSNSSLRASARRIKPFRVFAGAIIFAVSHACLQRIGVRVTFLARFHAPEVLWLSIDPA
ncbi:MAG: GNAT family N-acetyltransferase [Bryobacteraceae bacterium]